MAFAGAPVGVTLIASNLVKCFGSIRVINAATLVLPPGESIGISGESGAGKTTLLRCLSGLISFDEGEVVADGVAVGPGTRIGDASSVRLRRLVGHLFQQPALLPYKSGLANAIAGAVSILRMKRAEAERAALQLADRLGVSEVMQRYPCEMSGGQQRRVAIARALLCRPRYLLCDEPTNGLDAHAAGLVEALFSDLRRDGVGLLVASHHIDFLDRVSSRRIALLEGRLVAL